MARRSRVLLLALAAALVSSVAAAGRTLQQADASDPAPGSVPTRSGLELVQSAAGVGSFLGRQLDGLTGSYPNSLFLSTSGNGTYTDLTYGFVDKIMTVNMTVGNGTAPFHTAGVGLNSDPTDAISKPFLWLMDIGGNTVYKVDTVAGSIAGSFYSQPTNGAVHGSTRACHACNHHRHNGLAQGPIRRCLHRLPWLACVRVRIVEAPTWN